MSKQSRSTTVWPSMQQVESGDVEQLLRWNRKLPLAKTELQRAIIRLIQELLTSRRSEDPDAFVAASKSIGWV